MKDLTLPLICLPHWLNNKGTKNDNLYYPLTLSSSSATNSDYRDIFIIDANGLASELKTNRKDANYIDIESLSTQDIDSFNSSYIHLSSNHAEFEKSCFARIFYIRNTLREIGCDEALIVESDVLIFANLAGFQDAFRGTCQAALTDRVCPALAYVTLDYLDAFCEYTLNAYTSPSLLSSIKSIYENSFDGGKIKGGICDMTFNTWIYKKQFGWGQGITIRDSSGLIREGDKYFISDNRITKLNHGPYMFDSTVSRLFNSPHKRLRFDSSVPKCKMLNDGSQVDFISGHYQGGAKSLIGLHYSKFFSFKRNES